jgi:hypothetical protein
MSSLYTTSVMEKHHHNISAQIMEAVREHGIIIDKHPDFKVQYEKAILATDVSVHLARRKILQELVDKNVFSITLPQHRQLLKSLLMTCSDLFTSASDWQLQKDVAITVYEEFFHQGDVEKEMKLFKSKATTRTDQRGMAAVQVGFVEGIVLPAFKLLAAIVPECKDLVEGVNAGLEYWRLESEKPSSANAPMK